MRGGIVSLRRPERAVASLMRHSLPVLVALWTFAGCGGAPVEPTAPSAAPSASVAPTPSSSAAPSESVAAPKPPADPVRAAATKVLGCKWDDGEPDWNCAESKAWDELPELHDGKADATLVAMLAESEERLVYLAAKALARSGDKYRTDKALAEKVLVKLEGGVSPSVQVNLAEAVGAIDAKETGFGDRMLAVSQKLPVPARIAFIRSAQFRNSEFFYASTAALAKGEPDEKLREAAIRSFWVGTPASKGAEVCELWTTIAEDPKTPDALAGLAAGFAAWTNMDPCVKQYDRLLARVDKRMKAGPLDAWDWPNVVEHLADHKAASPAQKKKAIGSLKAMAENPKNSVATRSTCARALLRTDLPTGKAVIARFAKDKDEKVQRIAKDLENDVKDAEKREAEKKAEEKKPDGKKPKK